MLTAQQRKEFDERGFIRISASFSQVDATAMENRVWAALGEQYGVDRADPTTWTVTQAVGLRQLKTEPVFRAIGSPTTVEAIDKLLGAGRWRQPRDWGQFLVFFPGNESSWTVPCGVWHTDFGFLTPPGRTSGLLVFSFLSDVPPRSGGTIVVTGSHRLIRRFVEKQPRAVLEKMKRVRKAFLLSDPWLMALTSNEDDPDRVERFTETEHVISGTPVRVAELNGRAGDVVIAHPWLLHTSAPNCGSGPRIMCVQRVRLVDALPDSVPRVRRRPSSNG